MNVYPHYTYEINTTDRELEENKEEAGIDVSVSQAYNFGQTPSQIFSNPHKVRYSRHKALKYNLIADKEATIRPYRPVDNQRNVVIFYSKFIDNKKILTITREKTIKSFNLKSKTYQNNMKSPFTIEASYEKNLPLNYSNYLESANLKDNTFQILDEVELLIGKGGYIVRGGLWNGVILVCNIETGKMSIIEGHTSTVTCISVDEKDKLCVSGSKKGDIIFWEILADKQEWKMKCRLYNHEDFVTSIYISDSIILTASLDSTINMYSYEGELLRTFYHPQGNPILTVVYSNAPLPCVVFYSYRDKIFYSYSVNGKFLGSCSEDKLDPSRGIPEDSYHYTMVRTPKVVADSYFNDHLIYGTDKGTILIRALPYLDSPRHLLVATGHSTLTLLISPDRRFLLAGTSIGGLRVLTDPSVISVENEERLTKSSNEELMLTHSRTM